MTTDTPIVVAPRDTSKAWTSLRLALAGLWLVAAVSGYVLHERPSTLEDLYASVAAGEVASVHLVGGLPPGSTGYAELEVHWRSGHVPRIATVQVVRSSGVGSNGVASNGEGSSGADEMVSPPPSDEAVTTDDVAHEVAIRDPAVHVVQSGFPSGFSFTSAIFGWSVPTWVSSLMFVVWLGSLYVLIAGPEPWRATRWAWFWLGGVSVGSLLFLVLSGPTPALPAPRDPARRLTGGWAFLLSLVLPHTPAI